MKTFKSPINKELNVSGVYLVMIDTYMYIGSSICVKQRLQSHIRKLKKSKHENRYMQNRFDKYGINGCCYCLLEECHESQRLYVEKSWIEKLSPDMNSKMDPITQTNSKTQSKIVYQYDLEGNYIGYFPSVNEAARVLNIQSSSIASCCRKNSIYKSSGGYMWSYAKVEKLNYVNNSSKAKIKKVTMFTKLGQKLKVFDSIVSAAKYLLEKDESLESLSASISSAAGNNNNAVKDKYIFGYGDIDTLMYTGSKNFPVLQQKLNGEKIIWNSAKEAAETLNINLLSITRVIRGERKTYKESIWSDARLKQGELLGTPITFSEDNQQPSLSSNTLEGSTTNSRVLPSNVGDSNANTSALPGINGTSFQIILKKEYFFQ
jgi:endo-alpha-1,4-polygalactosaminidase (GH114 family)